LYKACSVALKKNGKKFLAVRNDKLALHKSFIPLKLTILTPFHVLCLTFAIPLLIFPQNRKGFGTKIIFHLCVSIKTDLFSALCLIRDKIKDFQNGLSL
jgi:hypothetical protein